MLFRSHVLSRLHTIWLGCNENGFSASWPSCDLRCTVIRAVSVRLLPLASVDVAGLAHALLSSSAYCRLGGGVESGLFRISSVGDRLTARSVRTDTWLCCEHLLKSWMEQREDVPGSLSRLTSAFPLESFLGKASPTETMKSMSWLSAGRTLNICQSILTSGGDKMAEISEK